MAARITRAKKKIAAARIPYRVPTAADLPERVSAVCDVVHLVFTTGGNASAGEDLIRDDLVASAIGLARTLHRLLPIAEPAGLLALLVLIDARRATRIGEDGQPVLLEDQDRSQWDRKMIAEGIGLLTDALRGGPPTRYAVQGAIAAVHAEAPTFAAMDWTEIVALYDVLLRLWPSPVVELNRAVAVGMRDGPKRDSVPSMPWRPSRLWRRTAISAPRAPTSFEGCDSGRKPSTPMRKRCCSLTTSRSEPSSPGASPRSDEIKPAAEAAAPPFPSSAPRPASSR